MTVPSDTNRSGPYNGNGVTTVFNYGFRIVDEDHLRVILTSAAGVETVLVVDADYIVSDVGEPAGGQIALMVAPETGETITILRSVPLTQETDLENQGAYYAETVEDRFDLTVMQIQQVAEEVDRAVRVPAATDPGTDLQLPAPEANGLIGWNETATGLQNLTPDELVTVISYGTANADIFTGDGSQTVFTLSDNPGALNNLDVAIGGVTQLPGVDYIWLSGTTLTFTTAPADGAVVLVRYMQALPQGVADSAATTFAQSGEGALEQTVADKLRRQLKQASEYDSFENYMENALSGGFFTQNGAIIQRGERIMLGGAVYNDCAFPNIHGDWLTEYQQAAGLPNGSPLSTQFVALNAGDTEETAGGAVLGGIQSLNFASAGTSAIGVSGYVVNNNPTLATKAWAFYGEAHKDNATAASVYGMELDTRTLVDSITPHPFQQGDVIGIQIGSGCELSATGQFDASAAIQVVANPKRWKAGFVFHHDSLVGATGGVGDAAAMIMAPGQNIEWKNNAGRVGRLRATNTNAATAMGIEIGDGVVSVHCANGVPGFSVYNAADAANYIFAGAAAAANPPFFACVGPGAAIDLQLSPKGTGVVKFGTWTSNGDAAVNGYITIKDAGGTVRKLATIA